MVAVPVRGRRLVALVTGLLLAAGPALAGCGGGPPEHGGPIEGPDGSGLFAGAGSVWHQPVPADAPVDPRSAEYVRQLVSRFGENPPVVSVNGYTVPVYDADASTPRYRITATEDLSRAAGRCPPCRSPTSPRPTARRTGTWW